MSSNDPDDYKFVRKVSSKNKDLERQRHRLEILRSGRVKIMAMQSCHVISHPLKNVKDDQIIFNLSSDGSCHGYDYPSDFTGTFRAIKKAMLVELDYLINNSIEYIKALDKET